MRRAGNVLAAAAGAAVSVALLAAGCSDDTAAPASTTDEPITVETTSPPPTTGPPTTEPATTVAPTTTLDPAAALAAQVEADFLEADRLANEASQDPFNAELEQAAIARRVGFALETFQARLADYRAANQAIRTNERVPASVVAEAPAVQVGDGVAEIQICEVDSWILVEVGAGPNGSDAAVDPDILVYRSIVFLRNVDGVWKIEGGNEIGRWEGVTACPPG